MVLKNESIVEPLAAEAIRLGADLLEVEYKDGYRQVFATRARVGFGIARLPSSSPEAATLREELHRLAKRKRRRIVVNGCAYELRCGAYDSFGEEAFCVELRRG